MNKAFACAALVALLPSLCTAGHVQDTSLTLVRKLVRYKFPKSLCCGSLPKAMCLPLTPCLTYGRRFLHGMGPFVHTCKTKQTLNNNLLYATGMRKRAMDAARSPVRMLRHCTIRTVFMSVVL